MMYEPQPHPEGQLAVLEFVLSHLRTSSSFVDIGCGEGKYTHSIKAVRPDIQAWALDWHGPSMDRVTADVKIRGTLPGAMQALRDEAVDAVVCLDVIEHFEKADAMKMIRDFDRVARQVIVLFTPLGWMPQDGTEENPYQAHRCGFQPAELEKLGYKTTAWRAFDYGPGKEPHDALWGVRWP
jgi:Methyltransferase domain